jgi:hypothetical protein
MARYAPMVGPASDSIGAETLFPCNRKPWVDVVAGDSAHVVLGQIEEKD